MPLPTIHVVIEDLMDPLLIIMHLLSSGLRLFLCRFTGSLLKTSYRKKKLSSGVSQYDQDASPTSSITDDHVLRGAYPDGDSG